MSLAEKFQITIPPKKDESDQGWIPVSQARVLEGVQNPDPTSRFNITPQLWINAKYPSAFGFGGDTDVSGGVNPETLKVGFHRREMKATDDQYGGEHVDLFYGEATNEDGETGFVERNNYLDRL